MTTTLPARSELEPRHTWNAESVFPSLADWEAEVEAVGRDLAGLEAYQGRLGESGATLLQYLSESEALEARLRRAAVWAGMGYSVDTADQAAAARNGRATSLGARFAAATAFARPELLAIGPERLRALAAEEPGLSPYTQFFAVLERRRPHVRSAEVEELLGAVGDPFRTAAATHGVLTNTDLKFEPVRNAAGEELEVAQGSLAGLLASPEPELRRAAWTSYADGHLRYANTMGNALAAGVKQDAFRARARRYPSSLEAALGESDIPVAVFRTLIEVYRKHLPTWHRYWAVRRRVLGLSSIGPWDVFAPLGPRPAVPYETAAEWLAAGLAPLGEEYVAAVRRGLTEERWVDVHPNRGKRMGAFSSGAPGTHPFILMSFRPDLFGLSTLAHEVGHSMHSLLTWRRQPPVYTRYGLFVAEVASNFNQVLVRAHLLATNPDPDFQLAVLEEAFGNFHRYFFVMPALARFELEIHERVERGEALTADGMSALMASLFKEGYGEEVEFDAERVGITWAQFSSHLYSNFYVYQYATGIAGAHALAGGVLEGRPGARERYLEFLAAGSSLDPLDALRLAGVDLESPEPVERAFGVLVSYVDRLEEIAEGR